MRVWILVSVVFLFAPLGLAAQHAPDSASMAGADDCEAGRVSHIFVDNHSLFDTTDPDLDDRFAAAYRIANALHIRTRTEVIRRELLVSEGDCHRPMLLEESERLLRDLGFLSRVDIYPVRQPDSTYHVIVDTQDEWSTRVDVRARWDGGPRFEGARLRETNLLGTGQKAGIFYFEREATRDYGITYATPQLVGTRWNLEASAGRTRAGTFVTERIAHPFVGETGRWAAQQNVRYRDRFFDYVVDGRRAHERHVLAPIRDESANASVLTRRGEPGDLTVLGGAVAYRSIGYPGGREGVRLVEGDDYDERRAAPAALAADVVPQLRTREDLRLFFLLGRRTVRWVQRRGLDSMRGEQDIRLGTEARIAIGPSFPIRNDDRDLVGTVSLYGGAEAGRGLFTGRLRADARRTLAAGSDAEPWSDMFTEVEALAYWRPDPLPRHTLLLRAAGAGGWNTSLPFQLTLGGARGVRGYEPERFPGGRRVVLSLEDRIYFGWPFRDVLDMGGTVFFDAGRTWPGDAPFGTDSGWRAAAGLGLRASFPAGSRSTYRVDVAVPVDDRVDWRAARLIITVGESRGIRAGFGDPQLLRSRTLGAAGQHFDFPN